MENEFKLLNYIYNIDSPTFKLFCQDRISLDMFKHQVLMYENRTGFQPEDLFISMLINYKNALNMKSLPQ
jgi:hypothetical protein